MEDGLENISKPRLRYLQLVWPLLLRQSEDCLYLNIFVPETKKNGFRDRGKPDFILTLVVRKINRNRNVDKWKLSLRTAPTCLDLSYNFRKYFKQVQLFGKKQPTCDCVGSKLLKMYQFQIQIASWVIPIIGKLTRGTAAGLELLKGYTST